MKAGVPIVFATDAGVFPHGLNARQFPIMVERGMTPMQAIQSATSVAARYMGWSDSVGTLEAGKFGDLIAVRGNPLRRHHRCCRTSTVVIKGGYAAQATRSAALVEVLAYSAGIAGIDADLDIAVENFGRLALDLQLAAGHRHPLVAILVARVSQRHDHLAIDDVHAVVLEADELEPCSIRPGRSSSEPASA